MIEDNLLAALFPPCPFTDEIHVHLKLSSSLYHLPFTILFPQTFIFSPFSFKLTMASSSIPSFNYASSSLLYLGSILHNTNKPFPYYKPI